MIVVGDSDALLSRLKYLLRTGHKPIAFVLGSGLTRGSVPGVDRLVTAMRNSLQDDQDFSRFDRAVAASTPAERYQRAAEFIFLNRDQAMLNRIIRLAVLAVLC